MTKRRQRIVTPREVLLIEIERHCADTRCNARTRIGLTKAEARLYDGFACEACERWNADGLEERDIPDWWEELTITGLDALRARRLAADELAEADGTGAADDGAVARLSAAWQSEARRASLRPRGANNTPDDGGDE